MTTLPAGNYALRASPVVGVGGMYATGESEVNGPVTVSALGGPNSGIAHTWTFKEVEGKEHVYTISQFTTGSTFGGVVSVKHPHHPLHENQPLVTSQHPDEFYVSHAQVPGVENAYEISRIVKELGVQWLVGTHGQISFLD